MLTALFLFACSEYDFSADPQTDPADTDVDDPIGDDDDDAVPEESGGVRGRICAPDEATWIAGADATVEHEWGTSSTKTGSNGRFTLEGLPVGTHTITVEKGSFTTSYDFEVFDGEITELADNVDACVPIEQGDVKIAVVTGLYDDIGEIVDGLNFTFDTINGVNAGSAQAFLTDRQRMAQYDIIFFNCGMSLDWASGRRAEVGDNIADYVRNGGSIYASDWAYYAVEAAYPTMNRFHGDDALVGDAYVGDSGMVNATVLDSAMQTVLGGSNAQINYDLPSWVTMQSTQAEVLIEGTFTYSDPWSTTVTGPLAARGHDGAGTVLYTTFHNEHQTTFDMDLLLQEIILSL